MASVCKDGNGRRRIQYQDLNGKRPSIHLGKIDERTANAIAGHVDELVEARRSGRPVRKETANWVSAADPKLLQKMGKLGLIELASSAEKPNFTQIAEEHFFSRKDIKDSTKSTRGYWCQVIAEIIGDKPCDRYTKLDGEKLRKGLDDRGIAKPTVARMLRFARQIFGCAVRFEYIEKDPLENLRYNFKEGKLPDRNYIDLKPFEEMVASLPLPWKLLGVLARYAALRTPSESLLLRWSDVFLDAEHPYVHVTSPKTEAEGKTYRTVALHHRLSDLLREVKTAADPANDFVVDLPAYRRPRQNGAHGVNPRENFNRLIKKAGFTPPPKLFKTLRSSCLTDWAEKLSMPRTAAMAGNTVPVAAKHYLTNRSSDFKKDYDSIQTIKAIQDDKKAAQSGANHCQPSADMQTSNALKAGPIELLGALEKAAQKAAQSVQVYVGKDGNFKNLSNTEVLTVPGLTQSYLIVPDIKSYPARIRT